MSSTTPTIAFFGATGGCALAALVATLEAGYQARALARTPQRLTSLLEKRGLKPEATSKLVILQGNAKDQDAVTKTLVPSPGTVVDKIVFGIGGTPKLTPNPLKPTLDDPLVCQSSMSTILASIADIFTDPSYAQQQRPLVTAVSTTGMSAKRDIPLAMIPLYHWLLPIPHADKKVMEESAEKAKAEGVIRDFVIVKASLLTDGKRLGSEKVRVGWEGGEAEGKGPAVGYTISREDVGGFIFEGVVDGKKAEYLGKKVTVTY
ncbi:MAG: hypothetical protein Q9195_002822 [Heterodermia aff. obscurata]